MGPNFSFPMAPGSNESGNPTLGLAAKRNRSFSQAMMGRISPPQPSFGIRASSAFSPSRQLGCQPSGITNLVRSFAPSYRSTDVATGGAANPPLTPGDDAPALPAPAFVRDPRELRIQPQPPIGMPALRDHELGPQLRAFVAAIRRLQIPAQFPEREHTVRRF